MGEESKYESWSYFILVGAFMCFLTGLVFVAVTGATFYGIGLAVLGSLWALVEGVTGHNAWLIILGFGALWAFIHFGKKGK